jgi:hypothetical protein
MSAAVPPFDTKYRELCKLESTLKRNKGKDPEGEIRAQAQTIQAWYNDIAPSFDSWGGLLKSLLPESWVFHPPTQERRYMFEIRLSGLLDMTEPQDQRIQALKSLEALMGPRLVNLSFEITGIKEAWSRALNQLQDLRDLDEGASAAELYRTDRGAREGWLDEMEKDPDQSEHARRYKQACQYFHPQKCCNLLSAWTSWSNDLAQAIAAFPETSAYLQSSRGASLSNTPEGLRWLSVASQDPSLFRSLHLIYQGTVLVEATRMRGESSSFSLLSFRRLVKICLQDGHPESEAFLDRSLPVVSLETARRL